jgi:hypothetical protein
MRKIQTLSAAMAACLAVSFPVFAQDALTIDTLRQRVPDELLRTATRIFFAEDIKAGRLSEEKAFSYYKCATERYQDTIDDDTLRALLGGLAMVGQHHEPSAAEQAKLAQAVEKAGKAQMEAENACGKSLGVSGIAGKAFPHAGKPFPGF